MWFKVAQLILRNRILILSIIGALTIMFGYYAFTSLEMDNKYGNTLPKNSPAQDNYLQFKEMFGQNESTLVVAVKTDRLYTEENFLIWKKISDSIRGLPGIRTVFSETDLFVIKNNKKEKKFETEAIFSDQNFEEKSVEEIKAEIRNNPMYDGLLYNDSTKVSLMLINFEEEYLDDVSKSDVVFDAENIALAYEHVFGEMHFAGLPHIRVVMGKRIVNEMYIFIGLAIAVTSLLLYINFRSLRVVVFCNIVIFTAVIWSLGSIAVMGFKISILMALIPPLMIVIGIPDCVYLLMFFHQQVKDHGNTIKALSRMISRVGNATFLTNVTTAIGFSTFIFVNSEKLKEFGLASSLNIIGVFILSICIIPILFSFTKRPKERHLRHLDKKYASGIIDKILHITTTNRKTVYITTAIIVAISIFGATKIVATGNLTSDLPESDPILQDIKFIEKNFNGAIPFEILVDYKKDGRKFDRAFLQKLEGIQDFLEKDTVFSKPISIVNFIKLINMSYYDNNPDMYKLIERSDMLRLRDYVEAFESDMYHMQTIHRYQDSLEKGNTSYADSLLWADSKIAQQVMNYVPKIAENDSLESSPYPSTEEISEFVANNDITYKVKEVSKELYPNLGAGLSLKEVVDTANTTYRIRAQVLDLGSYEMFDQIDKVAAVMDSVLNPNQEQVTQYFEKFMSGGVSYADSIFSISNAYRNNTTFHLTNGNDSLLFQFDLNPDLLSTYYETEDFKIALEKAIDEEEIDYLITGVSVVAAEGTEYLVSNLFTSIVFAIIVISLLMALLFGSWKMVLISMVPNFIPLIITAGVMGYFGIPIKPSTLLVFSIAFGISVDDTIHFLARYRRELKYRSHDQKGCIINALYQTGMSMFYTSIILLSGFSMFTFSQFGGTQALGLLISLTLFTAMLTNLILMPSLLFTLEKSIAMKALYKEPLIEIYDEEVDVDLNELEVDPTTAIGYKEEVKNE